MRSLVTCELFHLRVVTNTAATNWNDLPYDIRDCSSVRVFKRKLKSHLFIIAYIA